jgi:UDP-N-acetylmuramate dehydrogenase
MDIHTHIPIKNFTTMKIGGPARFMAEIRTVDELMQIYHNAKSQNLPVTVIGGGSNLIATDEGYDGVIAHMRIAGFEKISEDDTSVTIKAGGGESWDSVVAKSVEMGLSGIEAMSGIPGTAGASPIQNIGAYGQEISDTLVSVEAYDQQTDSMITLTSEQCEMAYRDSIFKSHQKHRYAIAYITLKLSRNLPQPPFYDSLQQYLDEHSITTYTPKNIRQAVLAIRGSKLPDPKTTPNSGSFFKNAIIEDWQANSIKTVYPDAPLYEMEGKKFKIPTGWMIETAGFKGKSLHGIKVHEGNALVLINHTGTASYADLKAARDEIVAKVRDMFGVIIEQEPVEI